MIKTSQTNLARLRPQKLDDAAIKHQISLVNDHQVINYHVTFVFYSDPTSLWTNRYWLDRCDFSRMWLQFTKYNRTNTRWCCCRGNPKLFDRYWLSFDIGRMAVGKRPKPTVKRKPTNNRIATDLCKQMRLIASQINKYHQHHQDQPIRLIGDLIQRHLVAIPIDVVRIENELVIDFDLFFVCRRTWNRNHCSIESLLKSSNLKRQTSNLNGTVRHNRWKSNRWWTEKSEFIVEWWIRISCGCYTIVDIR